MSVAIPSCLLALDSSNPYDLQVRVLPIFFFKAKNGGRGGGGGGGQVVCREVTWILKYA